MSRASNDPLLVEPAIDVSPNLNWRRPVFVWAPIGLLASLALIAGAAFLFAWRGAGADGQALLTLAQILALPVAAGGIIAVALCRNVEKMRRSASRVDVVMVFMKTGAAIGAIYPWMLAIATLALQVMNASPVAPAFGSPGVLPWAFAASMSGLMAGVILAGLGGIIFAIAAFESPWEKSGE